MFRLYIALFTITMLVGCDAEVERFQPNAVHALTVSHTRSVGTESAAADVTQIVDGLFGSPNAPRWPAKFLPDAAADLVDVDNLARAAGAVSSDKEGTHRGLFLEHCATCHALEGSGAGPASLIQNPYPRDFRPGIFKWKSTVRAARPTHDDLLKLIHNGAPGTGMPSFALIDAEDREALVDYVIFLSVRGEVERKLLSKSVDVLGYEDGEVQDADFRLRWPATDESEPSALISSVVGSVAQQWMDAKSMIAPVATPESDRDAASIVRGKELFHGQIANCVGCHGPQGNGQAVTLDYDDWAKEYSTRLGLTPTDRQGMKPFRAAGALRPRQIRPRTLLSGVFRGGSDSKTVYRRISQGIAGTPMPGIEITQQTAGTGLTSNQVWDLVHYAQSLGSVDHALSGADPKQQ